MIRTLLIPALLAVLAAPAALAQTTVTTSTFDSASTSGDIALSCQEMAVTATGSLSAKCNARVDGEMTEVSTTFDMRNATDCTGSASGGYSIVWSTSGTFDGSFINPAVVLSSTGQSYLAQGQCDPTDGDASATSTLDVSSTTNGLKNSSGSLVKR